MAQKRYSHIHKYMRVRWGKNATIIFKCMLDNCSHYVHKEMFEGRRCICWNCGKPFIAGKVASLRKKPKCPACINHPEQVQSITDEKLDDLLKGI
jgi:hypothetical protein